MRPRTVVVAAGIGIVAVASIGASAHRPISIGGAYPGPSRAALIEEIDVSQVAYVSLTAEAPQLWLTFEIDAPDELRLSLGIPLIDRLRSFRPSIAVLGPGLPKTDLPFLPPDVGGGVMFRGDPPSEEARFFEPFTGTESWITVEETVDLPEPGRYYVVAWAPEAEADKVWVAVGFLERFTLSDVLSLPTIVRDVRSFHELGPREPVVPWESLLVVGLIAGLVLGRCAVR